MEIRKAIVQSYVELMCFPPPFYPKELDDSHSDRPDEESSLDFFKVGVYLAKRVVLCALSIYFRIELFILLTNGVDGLVVESLQTWRHSELRTTGRRPRP